VTRRRRHGRGLRWRLPPFPVRDGGGDRIRQLSVPAAVEVIVEEEVVAGVEQRRGVDDRAA